MYSRKYYSKHFKILFNCLFGGLFAFMIYVFTFKDISDDHNLIIFYGGLGVLYCMEIYNRYKLRDKTNVILYIIIILMCISNVCSRIF